VGGFSLGPGKHLMPDKLPALRILVVDDEANIRFAISACLEAAGHEVLEAGTIESALDQAARIAFDLIFLDVRLGTQNGLDFIQPLLTENPWARIVVITAYASVETAVQAMKLGATDYLPKPFEHAQLTLLTAKVAERRLLERKIDALQKTLGAMDPESDFPTSSPVWRAQIELARRVADSNVPVLIRGEAGTGKGRLARAIHQWSQRSGGPFASVAFEGQPVEDLETELFGATASADVRPGAVAVSHGGTLLLDNISKAPMQLQPQLMTLMRDKEYERPDIFTRRSIDIRVIATTSANLWQAVENRQFREDLLMALSVVEVLVPALRERPEDIMLLAERYLAHFSREHHRPIIGISRDAGFVLRMHAWPGNVRELRNVIERAVLTCTSDIIGLDHLPVDLVNAGVRGKNPPTGDYKVGDLVPLEVIEDSHIRQVLASAKTIRRAAAILGVNACALSRKVKLKGLRPEVDDDKSAE
jgi:NtrC-family two-component system response regulator AlgB